MSKTCIFCSIIERREPSVQVHHDDGFLVLMDKYLNPGHALLMPIKHYETLLQMPPVEVGKLYSLVPTIAKAIVSAVKADGFNVGQNNGIAATRLFHTCMFILFPGFMMIAQMESGPQGELPCRRIVKIAQQIKEEIS